jgi:hypothetical protein
MLIQGFLILHNSFVITISLQRNCVQTLLHSYILHTEFL